MTLLAEHVVHADGTSFELGILDSEFRHPLLDKSAEGACLAYAAEISLHVCHEAGHACLAECLCKNLQGNGFTCTGRTGDESMAVSHLAANRNWAFVRMGYI